MSKELKKQLAFAENQYEIHKLQALKSYAEATTGVATMKKISRGREPTPEEKEKGSSVGYTELTDQEKIQHSLECMQRHIHNMRELNETIYDLKEKL